MWNSKDILDPSFQLLESSSDDNENKIAAHEPVPIAGDNAAMRVPGNSENLPFAALESQKGQKKRTWSEALNSATANAQNTSTYPYPFPRNASQSLKTDCGPSANTIPQSLPNIANAVSDFLHLLKSASILNLLRYQTMMSTSSTIGHNRKDVFNYFAALKVYLRFLSKLFTAPGTVIQLPPLSLVPSTDRFRFRFQFHDDSFEAGLRHEIKRSSFSEDSSTGMLLNMIVRQSTLKMLDNVTRHIAKGSGLLLFHGISGIGKSYSLFIVVAHLMAESSDWNEPKTDTVRIVYIHDARIIVSLDMFECFHRIILHLLTAIHDIPKLVAKFVPLLELKNPEVLQKQLLRMIEFTASEFGVKFAFIIGRLHLLDVYINIALTQYGDIFAKIHDFIQSLSFILPVILLASVQNHFTLPPFYFSNGQVMRMNDENDVRMTKGNAMVIKAFYPSSVYVDQSELARLTGFVPMLMHELFIEKSTSIYSRIQCKTVCADVQHYLSQKCAQDAHFKEHAIATFITLYKRSSLPSTLKAEYDKRYVYKSVDQDHLIPLSESIFVCITRVYTKFFNLEIGSL